MEENVLRALISLLDDEDREVYSHVREKLLSLGPEVIPSLEQVWTENNYPAIHEKLEDLIHDIQFSSLRRDFAQWAASLDADLLTGAWLVSRLVFPGSELDDIRRKMLRLRQHIWLELNANQTPLEQVHTFNQILFYHEAFRGHQADDPHSFCLPYVLEKRTGNSLSLGILYLCLSADLNLPVYGVNLPRHFVLAFSRRMLFSFSKDEALTESDLLFYINPVNKGSVFSRNEIKDYLKRLKLDPNPSHFLPASPKQIILLLIQQMQEAFQAQKDTDRQQDLEQLKQMLLDEMGGEECV